MSISGWIRGAVAACLLAMLFTFLVPIAPNVLAMPPAQSDTGEFRMIVGEPSSLDPNIATDFSIYVTSQLFDALYRLQDDGTLKMLGAESYEVSEDGLIWTFKLNPNAKWSDGQPVTADDWVYSWLRALSPELGSAVATFMTAIKGASDYTAGTITDPAEVGLRAVDPLTFEVTMAQPSPQFQAVAGLPYLTPVPRHVIEQFGDEWTEAPNLVSNGPYKLEAWDHDQQIVLARNENYGSEPPAIERALLTIATGDPCVAQVQAYEADEVDFATCVPSQDIARMRDQYPDEFSLQPLSATIFPAFDNSQEPWNDVRVRQAFSLAIDRQAIVDVLTEGTSEPAPLLVPEGIVGRDDSHALTGTVDDAKQLLADAGYPDGAGFPEFTITTTVARGRKELAELVQQMWKDNLGVTGTVEVLEENAYRAWVNARKDEPYDIQINAWYTDYVDPNNWYKEVFVDDYRNMHFTNEEFIDLVDQAAFELDEAKRAEHFTQADAILEREVPAIPAYYPTDIQLRKPWLQGLGHTDVLGLYYISEAGITAP
jgi:oligopeptide transport system substrate-binding protein